MSPHQQDETPLMIFLSSLLEINSKRRPTVRRSISVLSDDCPSHASVEEAERDHQLNRKKRDAQNKQRGSSKPKRQGSDTNKNKTKNDHNKNNSLLDLMTRNEVPLSSSDPRWDSATSFSDESMPPRSPVRRTSSPDVFDQAFAVTPFSTESSSFSMPSKQTKQHRVTFAPVLGCPLEPHTRHSAALGGR